MTMHPDLVNNPHVSQVNEALPADDRFDPWHWEAVYDSGERSGEYSPETGEHRPWALALEHLGRMTHVLLLPRYPERYPVLQQLVVQVPEGARPLFFRQRDAYVILDPDGPLNVKPRITAIGWRRPGDEHVLLACYDDGSMFLTDKREAL